MASYTVVFIGADDAALNAASRAEGYAVIEAFIQAKMMEVVRGLTAASDERLIARARQGESLAASEKARLKSIFGLP